MGHSTVQGVLLMILIGASGPARPAIGAPPAIGAAPIELRSDAPTADQPAGTIAFSSLAPRGWDLYVLELHPAGLAA